MAGHRSFKGLTKSFSPERKARVAARVDVLKKEMALHELRQARERSQEELARELKVGQPAVAKLERRADMYVSNLRRYIEALGGSLEITARFPEGSVNIVNFGELGERRAKKFVVDNAPAMAGRDQPALRCFGLNRPSASGPQAHFEGQVQPAPRYWQRLAREWKQA